MPEEMSLAEVFGELEKAREYNAKWEELLVAAVRCRSELGDAVANVSKCKADIEELTKEMGFAQTDLRDLEEAKATAEEYSTEADRKYKAFEPIDTTVFEATFEDALRDSEAAKAEELESNTDNGGKANA